MSQGKSLDYLGDAPDRNGKEIFSVKKEKFPPGITYDSIYSDIRNDLITLKNSNRIIPKLINKHMKEEQQKTINRITKEAKVNKQLKKDLDVTIKLLGDFTDGKVSKKSVKIDTKIVDFITRYAEVVVFIRESNIFIREMSLLYMITKFEEFLRRMLSITFDKHPTCMITKQKSLTFEELSDFKNINDLRGAMIDKELDNVFNQDIEKINEYLKTTFKIDLSKNKNWHLFKERFYRRNILVHNNCFPNKIYKIKTDYKGKNERLNISKKYLDKSIDIFERFSEIIFNKFNIKFKEKKG